MDDELRAWFEAEGLMRYAVIGDERGDVIERTRPPVVALGTHDDDFVTAPNPDTTGFRGRPLRAMRMEDYNQFMYLWLEQAVAAGVVSCANCGKRILAGDDLPDPETWDAIFIEKEIVAWMLVHFDCKKWLAKKLKGVHPFDLEPREPPQYDLSAVEPPPPAGDVAEEGMSGADGADGADGTGRE